MPIIIGISGRKQSGKSTLARYLQACYSINNPYGVDSIQCCYQALDGIITATRASGASLQVREGDEGILSDGRVKSASFADNLKKKICIDILGVDFNAVYGSDQQKNAPTKILWDNFPQSIKAKYKKYSGPMSGRQIMQSVGTQIFRQMIYGPVWIESLFRNIKSGQLSSSDIVMIPDIRFPNQADAVLENGGYVIRLTQKKFEDGHVSQSALDDYNWSKSDRCYVLNNVGMTMFQKAELGSKMFDQILKREGKK